MDGTTTTLPGAVLRQASVSAQDNNAFLLTCATTGRQLLVDAADSAPALLRMVGDAGGPLDTVLTTHQHWDHHRALAAVVAASVLALAMIVRASRAAATVAARLATAMTGWMSRGGSTAIRPRSRHAVPAPSKFGPVRTMSRPASMRSRRSRRSNIAPR